MRRRYASLLIALSLALGISVPLLYGGSASFKELARLPGWAYLILAAMVMLAWCCNAARLYLLSASLGHALPFRGLFAVIGAADFAAAVTPAGSGGLATKLYALQRRGLPVGRGVAMVAVDRLLDFAWFALAMPIAALLWAFNGADSTQSLRMSLLLGLAAGGGLLGLLWLLRRQREVLSLLMRLPRRAAPHRWRYRLARALVQFRRALDVLLAMQRRRLLLLYLLCVGHWLLRYGVLPVLLWALDSPLAWAYLFMAQGLVLLAGQLAFLPGGGGAVELGLGLFLSPYLSPAATAAVLLAWRGFTYYGTVLAGAPLFVWTLGRARRAALMGDIHEGGKSST